ncbi:unnamed protein product [Peronospora belbahrii]|uniref:Uncharacterized protein n=1 Tax=Peronospora belbahrii TaxID=622444 RepID=A0AAU9L643_9STRA|nr:unnamed protein product [Peronospora belbahrii]
MHRFIRNVNKEQVCSTDTTRSALIAGTGALKEFEDLLSSRRESAKFDRDIADRVHDYSTADPAGMVAAHRQYWGSIFCLLLDP